MRLIDIDAHKHILAEVRRRYEINTPLRMAHFLAQVHHESAGMTRLTESMNYTPEALLSTFGPHRISREQAYMWGRVSGRPANQQAIANQVYGGTWGRNNLGNTQTGDGWRYRGRGPIQCTGRRNYAKFGSYLGRDFLTHPDLMATVEAGLLFAGWFWTEKRLNVFADMPWEGVTTIRKPNRALYTAGEIITLRINGGQIGLKEREALYRRYRTHITPQLLEL